MDIRGDIMIEVYKRIFNNLDNPNYQKLMYELNNLIYKLYDLNKKEIEIIEKKGVVRC